MKIFFHLGHYLSRIPGWLRVNPRVMLTVSISLAVPFSGDGSSQYLAFNKTANNDLVSVATVTKTTIDTSASLPAIQYKTTPKRRLIGTLFAYSSTTGQTDTHPTITASGLQVSDGTLATNCLPFGTKVRFPSLYGNKEFTVTDRMAPRHSCASFDIWHESLTKAKQFGRQVALVEVY